MGGSLVTVGTRHVKVWRVEGSATSTPITTPVKTTAGFFSPGASAANHRILQGRNCLLGALLEGTFTAVVAISSYQAIICSDAGDICLLDDINGAQRFAKIANVDFSISAATLGSNGNLIIAGRGILACFDVEDLVNTKLSRLEPIASIDSQSELNPIVALASLGSHIVTVDDHRIIKLLHPPSTQQHDSSSLELQLPAHGGAVLGVRCLPSNDVLLASFFTWSADGTILFWSADGICKRQFNIELDQIESADPNGVNELKVVRTVPSAKVMVTGDKFGVLRVIDEKTGKCGYTLHAHAGEITDIAVYDRRSSCIIASCGRDRTVQVFRKTTSSWVLQQTLDEHVGAVTGLMFTSDGKYLISSSSDRTIVVREALSRTEGGEVLTAFVIIRTITLKATPVSMTLLNDRGDVLLLSTMDRCVLKYSLSNGHQMSSFKTADSEGGDAVVLSSLTHLTTVNGSNILAGVSSTDKSLRLYDENGTLLSRDWGHTEGITDLTVLLSSKTFSPKQSNSSENSGRKCLVTVAVDGTVFIWTFGSRIPPHKADLSSSMELMGITPTKDILANKPPLRRVLSQSEMARFRQSSPEQDEHMMALNSNSNTPTNITPTNPIKRPTRALEKRASRFSLAQTPKLEPSISSYDSTGGRRRTTMLRQTRSPSPPSPKARKSPPRSSLAVSTSASIVRRKSSLGLETGRFSRSTRNAPINSTPTPAAKEPPASVATGAASGNASSPGNRELAASTDIICRALKAYRRKLAVSQDTLAPEMLRDIERELGLTARAVGEKAIKAKGAVDENVMVKVLSQYSERLIEMLDEKFKGVLTLKEGQRDLDGSITGSGGSGSGNEGSVTEDDSGVGGTVSDEGGDLTEGGIVDGSRNGSRTGSLSGGVSLNGSVKGKASPRGGVLIGKQNSEDKERDELRDSKMGGSLREKDMLRVSTSSTRSSSRISTM
jgi:WD40 repeat protein